MTFDLTRKSKELFQISGEEERGQRARVTDGGSEREPRRATQDSQGDQGDPSDGQKNPQAKSEAGKREVTEKLLGVVNNATEANMESPSDFWGTGIEEDQQGGDQVEVFNLEDGGDEIKPDM